MNEEENNFYRGKSWDLLIRDIAEMKGDIKDLKGDMQTIKNQRSYLMGIVATISILCTIAWQWITAKIQGGK